MALPVPQHVSSYRAEPANWGPTPREVGVIAGVGAVLNGGCLHSLCSPVPPAGEKPVSVPPPQPAWLSRLPWLTVLHEHGTPLHLLSAQPTTTRGKIQNMRSKLYITLPVTAMCINMQVTAHKQPFHSCPTTYLPELCASSCDPTASVSYGLPPAPVWAWKCLHRGQRAKGLGGCQGNPGLMGNAPKY